MNLKKLIQDLPIMPIGSLRDRPVLGLSNHSQSVAPGELFICKLPASSKAFDFLDEAIQAGACAVLTSEKKRVVPEPIIQLYAADVALMERELAKRFYPAENLTKIAVTGTNGKTTVTFLIRHMLHYLGCPTGLIGTVGYFTGGSTHLSNMTTPDFLTLQKLHHEMAQSGCLAVAMETSSHGLVQKRVEGIKFKVGVFTNLTQDHLDYHKDMESYAAAKKILFDHLEPQSFACINHDSEYAHFMVSSTKATVFRYGRSDQADLYAQNIEFSPSSTSFDVFYNHQTYRAQMPLVGEFNIYNVLAAMSSLIVLGWPLQSLVKSLPFIKQVPGRLERVENQQGLNIFVDFAHTPDALEQVCCSLQKCIQKQLIVVFGAGGDRDPTKRSLMGHIVDEYADYAIITSDNPRSEDPLLIAKAVAAGFKSKRYEIELDRKLAISKALDRARPGDTLLIAGKGHESYQIVGNCTCPFDDKQVTSQLLEERTCV
jgi:UDP-N-acetylmuramoyl-L-alanyl-D-glutamate--2,6-diaminopimelate ligase